MTLSGIDELDAGAVPAASTIDTGCSKVASRVFCNIPEGWNSRVVNNYSLYL